MSLDIKVAKSFQTIVDIFKKEADIQKCWVYQLALSEADFPKEVRGFIGKAARAGYLHWVSADREKMYWGLTPKGIESAYRNNN